jgi:hypothetical protein
MGGTCSTHGKDEKCIQKILVKINGEKSLRRPRHRWDDNTEMDLKERGCKDMECIHLMQNRDQWYALENPKKGKVCFGYMNNYHVLKKKSAPLCECVCVHE